MQVRGEPDVAFAEEPRELVSFGGGGVTAVKETLVRSGEIVQDGEGGACSVADAGRSASPATSCWRGSAPTGGT